MDVGGVCKDVRLFLRGLAKDLPEIFPAPPRRCYVRRVPRERVPEASRERARALITARVEHWAGLLDVKYGRIAIKGHRTLWGSCSRRGNLNFNWRLAAAPPEALDYVVIHELCHLREMNHSRAFWAHVAAACPAYKRHRRWLKDNCAALYGLRGLEPALG